MVVVLDFPPHSESAPGRTDPGFYSFHLPPACVYSPSATITSDHCLSAIMSNVQFDFPYNTDDNKSSSEEYAPQLPNDQIVARPPIDYSSIDAFFHSTWRRFLSLWTRRFVLSLSAGQLVSLCITCTNVTTQELTNGNWQLPTTQTFFLYSGLLSFRT
jgi:Solute carrier family 35